MSLRRTINDITRRTPKKLLPQHVTLVRQIVHTATDVADLYCLPYFETILWKFFHFDVTDSHIELICLLLIHEFEIGKRMLWNLAREEPSKFSDLVLRVLVSTMRHNLSHAALETLAFYFLACLAEVDFNFLQNSRHFPQWAAGLVPKFLLNESIDSSVHELVLLFCIRTCGIMTDLKDQVATSFGPALLLAREAISPRVAWYARELQAKTTSSPEPEKFTNFLRNHSLGELSLEASISILDKFRSFLDKVDEEHLLEFCRSLGYDGAHTSKRVLVEIVCQLSRRELPVWDPLASVTQESILDLFEPSGAVLRPWPEFLLVNEALESLNSHLQHVFLRLSVVDPPLNIKGNTKHFSTLKRISVNGCFASIETKSRVAARTGEFVVLIELQRPNKLDDRARMVKHGICTARVARVTSSAKAEFFIEWAWPGYEDRFNAVAFVPSSWMLALLEGEELKPNLEKAIENNKLSPEKLLTLHLSGKADKSFEPVLSHILNNLVSNIQTSGHEWPGIIDTFASYADERLPSKRTLVIVPNLAAVDLLPLAIDAYRLGSQRYSQTLSQKLEDLKAEARKLASSIDGDFVLNSASDALRFYEIHRDALQKRHRIQENGSGDEVDVSVSSGVVDVFLQLETFIPVETCSDYDQICSYWARRARTVVACVEDLVKVPNDFYAVFLISSVWPLSLDAPKTVLIDTAYSKKPFFYDGKTADKCSKKEVTATLIETPPLLANVNIEEAKSCIQLYTRLATTSQVLIVTCSPYMNLLLEEIFEEQGLKRKSSHWPLLQIADSCIQADTVILSTHGWKLWNDVDRARRSAVKDFRVLGQRDDWPGLAVSKGTT